ncbi:MFS transporter [Clostridium scatologenes]|uniref:Major facilitator superfamily MFS_1 n=1 Tax=Clostridium scatologenes TaxID=1548 RepID=A0A0E3M6A5_CLOSL|nr:MFS transporter [Clostridium scatologenes]AKA67344.1 major facilitator superfamily MFS_1 [Clostridium scatologenes]
MKNKNDILVLILGMAGFVSAADNWLISPILPAISAGFGASIAKTGIIITAYMIPYGIMQPVYGFFSDNWGKTKVLRWIVWGLALGTFGCAFATSLWILCIFRIITGCFAAGIIAVSLALIGDSVPLEKRQFYVGKFMGIVFLGQGLSVGLGGIFANYITWRIAFAFFAAISICVVFALRKIPENGIVTGGNNFFCELKKVVFSEKGRVIFPLALAAGFLLIGLYSYLGAYLHDSVGLNYLQVGAVVMFYGFACLAAGSKVGNVSKRFGYKKTIIFGGCLSLISALLLANLPYLQTSWISVITLGVGYIFIQSTLATLAFDVAAEAKGLPSALIGLGLFGGGGLGSQFSSFILVYGTYKTLWITFSIGIMLFILIVYKLKFN